MAETLEFPGDRIINQLQRIRRRIMRRVSIAAAVLPLFVLLCLGSFVSAQDAATNCADMCKVILDNEHVRVIDYWVKPGGKLPMHSHPAAVTYFITGGKMKTTLADGKVNEMEPKAGEARWAEAVTHANENTGTTESHVIVVEMKQAMKK
jgi:quercetin dioxygenase-like cupin family protein